jgi:hypothetical protein
METITNVALGFRHRQLTNVKRDLTKVKCDPTNAECDLMVIAADS